MVYAPIHTEKCIREAVKDVKRKGVKKKASNERRERFA
jgi:hypothetical protein